MERRGDKRGAGGRGCMSGGCGWKAPGGGVLHRWRRGWQGDWESGIGVMCAKRQHRGLTRKGTGLVCELHFLERRTRIIEPGARKPSEPSTASSRITNKTKRHPPAQPVRGRSPPQRKILVCTPARLGRRRDLLSGDPPPLFPLPRRHKEKPKDSIPPRTESAHDPRNASQASECMRCGTGSASGTEGKKATGIGYKEAKVR